MGFDAPGAEQHVVRCSPSPTAASSASTTITENVALECLGRADRPISLCVLWGELVAVARCSFWMWLQCAPSNLLRHRGDIEAEQSSY